MSIASSEKPNIKPVVLAEISVAMKMVGAVLYSTTTAAIAFEKEGSTCNFSKEGGADTIKKED